MKNFTILIMFFVAMFTTGCSEQLENGPFGVPDRGPVVIGSCGYGEPSTTEEECVIITWAIAHGVIKDDLLLNDELSRAIFLSTTFKAFEVELLEADQNEGFSDLEEGAWYMDAVATAKYHGIMKGYPDGTFKPTGLIIRAEALKSLSITNDIFNDSYLPKNYTNNYTECLEEDFWYCEYTEEAYAFQLVVGESFKPGKSMTLMDLLKFLYRGRGETLYNLFTKN